MQPAARAPRLMPDVRLPSERTPAMNKLPSSCSESESYLHAWHSRHAGTCPAVFAEARGRDGRSSYQRVASVVEDGASVLDVACGDGTLLALVRTVAPQSRLMGIDLSPTELRIARARLPEATLHQGRGQALPFRDSTVDVVLCHMALMLMDDPESVLADVRRVLKAGGVFRTVTNRPAAADALAKEVMQSLRPLWDTADGALLPPRLGDVRTLGAEPLAALVDPHFSRVSVECFEVTQFVPRDELWSHLVMSCYGFDALPDDRWSRLLRALSGQSKRERAPAT